MAKVERKNKNKEPQCMVVEFHLLMSEQVTFNPEEQSVYLVFGDEILGGWASRERPLSCSNREAEDVYELTFTETIPTDLITNDRYLRYKYFLKEKDKNDVIWEDYTTKGKSKNRLIKVPASYQKQDIWHQYDGFFEKKPAGVTAIILNWWNDLGLKHAEKSVQTFFPELKYKKENDVSEFMSHLNMMISGIKKVYFTDGQCWKSYIQEFAKFVSKQTLEILRKRCEGLDDKEQITILSLCLLLVLFGSELDIFSESDRTRLSQLLCPTVDPESQTCPELEAVTRYMNDKQSDILKAITKLVQGTMENTKDPSWLYLMPWIHFLSEDCKPFDNPPFDMGHDAMIPKWWGVASVSQHLDKFKKHQWNIWPSDMVKYLLPLFKMDYLMPRTFLAAVQLKELRGLISLRLFPVEVCLANLIFHLRDSRTTYTWRDRKIEKVYGSPPPTKRRYRQYSPSTLTKAYETVMDGDLSVRKASNVFNVPMQTLRDRVIGHVGPETLRSGPGPLLNELEEACLVEFIKEMARVGYAYTRAEVINVATEYAACLGRRPNDKPFSYKWFYAFLGRWP